MKRGPIRILFLTVVVLLLIAADLEIIMAADNKMITSVALIHEYNDNIRLNTQNELADNITTVAPKLRLVRHSERYTVQADGKLEFYRYQDYDEFDDMDQWYNGSLEATPTERWHLGADVHASDDNRPDRDVEETGLILSNIQRRRINAGTSANYTFSEVMGAGVSLKFNRENFDDPETSDRMDYHAVLSMNRSLDEWLARTTGRLNLGYSHYEFERDYDRTSTASIFQINTRVIDDYSVDNFSLTVGTMSAMTERLDLTVDLGGRYAVSQRDVEISRTYTPALLTEEPSMDSNDYDSYGFVGSIDFGYRGERFSSNLLLSHDLQPVSGENNAVNRTTVRAGSRLRILERLSGNLYVQWYRNQSDQEEADSSDVDTQTINVGGGFRWELSDHFDLAATYVYTFLDNRDDDTSAYRNKAMLTLDAHHDWLE